MDPLLRRPGHQAARVTYLGFSAETGELSDNHDIIKVETKNLYSPSGAAGTPKDYSKSAYRPNQYAKKEGGGWGWFFLKFVIFGLVVTGAYVGFTVFRATETRQILKVENLYICSSVFVFYRVIIIRERGTKKMRFAEKKADNLAEDCGNHSSKAKKALQLYFPTTYSS